MREGESESESISVCEYTHANKLGMSKVNERNKTEHQKKIVEKMAKPKQNKTKII